MLSIQGIHVAVDGKEIIKGVSVSIEPGKVYALLGPNGSGKSTLAYTLAGHPKYLVTKGSISFDDKDLLFMTPDLRAKAGIFLSFQYPKNIPGVTISSFLRAAYKAVKKKDVRVFEFQKKLKEKMDLLEMPHHFLERSVNEGFSGGEKKKAEILQAMILEPRLLILDETDSGLDIDALRIVADGIKKLMNRKIAILLITHYNRILQSITPDKVFVMKEGKIVAEGGQQLAKQIEKEGFEKMGDKKEERGFTILD